MNIKLTLFIIRLVSLKKVGTMKFTYLSILILAIGASGCKNNKAEYSSTAASSIDDTVSYSLIVHQFKHPMYHATEFTLEYPVLDSIKFPALSTAYEKKIIHHLYSNGGQETDKTSQNPIQLRDYFFNEYTNFRKEYPESAGEWYLNKFAAVVYNRHGILTVKSGSSDYFGGAHGNTSVYNTCFDAVSGEMIKLEQLFTSDSLAALNKVAEKYFRIEQQIPDSLSLPEAGFFDSFIVAENPGQFRINNNFALLNTGIEFQYNPYEIGPYAVGAPSFQIPYGDVVNLLSPEGKKKLQRLIK